MPNVEDWEDFKEQQDLEKASAKKGKKKAIVLISIATFLILYLILKYTGLLVKLIEWFG